MTDTLEIPAWVNGGVDRDGPEPFEYFYYADSRQELFEFCETTAAYITENEVDAVAFLDRGARPMGIGLHEYWKRTFGDEKPMPDILFINPEGFEDEVTAERLETEHPRLAAHADGTLLVIDTCIHSGSTMKPVVTGLEESGFEDVRIGVANNKIKWSRIKPDLVMQKRRPAHGCYPFRFDEAVVKGGRLLHSEANRGDVEITREAAELRREIKRIINECIEAGSSEGASYSGPNRRNRVRRARAFSAVGALAGAATAEYFSLKSHAGIPSTVGNLILDGLVGGVIGRVGGELSALESEQED